MFSRRCSSEPAGQLPHLENEPDGDDNLPFESWTEVLGSERLTGATLDRLTHRCQIIETKGESYRLRDAKARIRRPGAPREPAPKERATADPPGAMEGGPRTR